MNLQVGSGTVLGEGSRGLGCGLMVAVWAEVPQPLEGNSNDNHRSGCCPSQQLPSARKKMYNHNYIKLGQSACICWK